MTGTVAIPRETAERLATWIGSLFDRDRDEGALAEGLDDLAADRDVLTTALAGLDGIDADAVLGWGRFSSSLRSLDRREAASHDTTKAAVAEASRLIELYARALSFDPSDARFGAGALGALGAARNLAHTAHHGGLINGDDLRAIETYCTTAQIAAAKFAPIEARR